MLKGMKGPFRTVRSQLALVSIWTRRVKLVLGCLRPHESVMSVLSDTGGGQTAQFIP